MFHYKQTLNLCSGLFLDWGSFSGIISDLSNTVKAKRHGMFTEEVITGKISEIPLGTNSHQTSFRIILFPFLWIGD